MVRTLTLIAVILVALAGCSGPHSEPSPTTTPNPKANEPGGVVADITLTNLDAPLRDAAASARVVTYTSRSGVDDSTTHVSASIFVPKGKPPEGGFPIVALGHGTTGTDPGCAPSLSPNLQHSATTVQALLNAGYVVAVPDYQGLGKPAVDEDVYYPYLDSTTAGYNMIDAVRATRNVVPQTSSSWAALGVNEGGQAAWAANELAENYGYDLKLIGTASISPIIDVQGLADAAESGQLSTEQKLTLIRYLAALKAEYPYDFNLGDYRRGHALQHWDAALGCDDSTSAQRLHLVAQITPDDLRPNDAAAAKTLRGYFEKTSLPQGPTQAPMLVIYSGQDPLTPAGWTERAINRACAMGDVITIQSHPDAAGVPAGPADALSWIGDRFRSVPAPNDCQSFTQSHRIPG
jgi:alpha-beta hydrolase superfamily lysophospholipase